MLFQLPAIGLKETLQICILPLFLKKKKNSYWQLFSQSSPKPSPKYEPWYFASTCPKGSHFFFYTRAVLWFLPDLYLVTSRGQQRACHLLFFMKVVLLAHTKNVSFSRFALMFHIGKQWENRRRYRFVFLSFSFTVMCSVVTFCVQTLAAAHASEWWKEKWPPPSSTIKMYR